MFKKNNIMLAIVMVLILSFVQGIITYNVTFSLVGINILSTYAWFGLLLIAVVMFQSRVYASKSILLVAIYGAIVMLMQVMGHLWNTAATWMASQIYPLLLAILIYEVFIHRPKGQHLKLLMHWALWMIAISCVINIVSLWRFPQAVRFIVGGNTYANEIVQYYRLGISGYGFFSALPPLVPVIIYMIRKASSKVYVVLLLALLVLIFLAIILSTITTPLILASLALILSLFGRTTESKLTASIIVGVFIIFSLIIPPQVAVIHSLDTLIAVSPSREAKLRLNDIKSAVAGNFEVTSTSQNLTSFEARFQRVYWNLETISKYPLFGSSRETPPEAFHLFWLYLIASFGIVGALPMIILLIYQIRINYRFINSDYRVFYMIAMGTFFAMGLAKNIAGWLMYLVPFVIVPGIGYLYRQDPSNTNAIHTEGTKTL